MFEAEDKTNTYFGNQSGPPKLTRTFAAFQNNRRDKTYTEAKFIIRDFSSLFLISLPTQVQWPLYSWFRIDSCAKHKVTIRESRALTLSIQFRFKLSWCLGLCSLKRDCFLASGRLLFNRITKHTELCIRTVSLHLYDYEILTWL